MSDVSLRPVIVSCGEPAGIGPDIALMAWERMRRKEIACRAFVYLGDEDHLRRRAEALGIAVSLALCREEGEFRRCGQERNFLENLPVFPLEARVKGEAAKPNRGDQRAVLEAIEKAVRFVREKWASALVTLPIHKNSLYRSGFEYPGHTEFLAALADPEDSERAADSERAEAAKKRSVMMMVSESLKTVPVTVHMPLEKVAQTLSADLIFDTARIVERDLRRRFAIKKPILAICGLNPHAGEEGALGRQEEEVIAPAIERMRAHGIECSGPLAADSMFHETARARYDAALCMYHDQALIPIKSLAFNESVNATLGLPFVRTSPDHGTAFDIAATGKADIGGFIAALRAAKEMAENQDAYDRKDAKRQAARATEGKS